MDDWEDDFVPAAPFANVKNDWEGEDEEEEVAKVVVSAASIEAAAKKAKEEEIRLANVLKFAVLEDESPDEKKARERKQIEDADAELAGELFGGKSAGIAPKAAVSLSSGIAASAVKSKSDHISFGTLVAKKLTDSNAFNVGVFYKQLTEKISKNLTLESCDEVLAILTKVRNNKRIRIRKPNIQFE